MHCTQKEILSKDIFTINGLPDPQNTVWCVFYFDLAAILCQVKQRGPNCAAAVIAGTINALKGKKDACTLGDALDVYRKLRPKDEYLRKERASTKKIGNANLKKGLVRLGKKQDVSVKITSLISGARARVKGKLVLKENKLDSELDSCWEELKVRLTRKHRVLLAHIRNHYCLVYGLREWQGRQSKQTVREVLIAKKGQSPNTWIELESFLKIFAASKKGWYKLFVAARR